MSERETHPLCAALGIDPASHASKDKAALLAAKLLDVATYMLRREETYSATLREIGSGLADVAHRRDPVRISELRDIVSAAIGAATPARQQAWGLHRACEIVASDVLRNKTNG